MENFENEICRWFYQEDFRNGMIIWKEFDENTTELIEVKYQDYVENKNDSDFHKCQIDDIGYEIDFLNKVQISIKDKSLQRSIGRFKGDPNNNSTLRNTMISIKYKWYFLANEENSPQKILAPYRIADNDKIDEAFVNFKLCKGSNIFKGSVFSIDFDKMEETCNSQGKTKQVFRLKECPTNITRFDYYNNEIKPIKTKSIVMNENSISSMKSDFYLNFRNIFPFRCYDDNQTFNFYYSSAEKEVILHLESGWTHNDDEIICGQETTQELLKELTNDRGFKLLLKVSRNQEQFRFEETNPIPLDCLKKIFKKNWYYRLNENNCFIWKQYQPKISSQIESYYKNNYLLLGDKENIEISSDLVVNFVSNSQIVPNGKNRSMMRLNITKPFPDKISTINVPEEIHTAINSYNDQMKNSFSQTVLYANKYGPSNIKELIEEIRKELEKESSVLVLEQEYKAIDNNYLQNLNNFNFASLIIKIYTEESFVYRRINKILREHDISLFMNLKYYYFSLLYSLKVCRSSVHEKTLFRGMKLRNQVLTNLYSNLEQDQMLQFNEFLSTTYDRNIAEKYADKGKGSFLIEIHVPEDIIISSIENYSRFQHEKEVLLPSGSILQFTSKSKNADELTTLSLRLVKSNIDAFSYLLKKIGSSIDLSNINFTLIELQTFFDCLKSQKEISKLTLKVYNPSLIGYIAHYVSLIESIPEIIIVNDRNFDSYSEINYSVSSERSIKLRNFNSNDKYLFVLKLVSNNQSRIINLNLIDLEDAVFIPYSSSTLNLNLKSLSIQGDSKKINPLYRNFPFFLNSKSLYNSLKELDLKGFITDNNYLAFLIKLCSNSKSLEIVNFSTNDCTQIESLAYVFKCNASIKKFTVFFENSYESFNKITIGEQLLPKRNIYFLNLNQPDFIRFLDILISVRNQINYLDLSGNKLSKDIFITTFIKILSDLKALADLNLSDNCLCDSFIKESQNFLTNNNSLKCLNLDKNQLFSTTKQILSQIKHYSIYSNGQTKVLAGHTKSICCLVKLSNGNIASCSKDSSIKIWDANDNFNNIHTLQGHQDSVNSLIELSNGDIASCSDDRTIKIWDAKSNYSNIQTLKNLESIYSLIELSDGIIASYSNLLTILIWEPYNSKEASSILYGHLGKVNLMTKLSNGNLASCSDDKTIRIWNAKKHYQSDVTLSGHKYSVNSFIELSNKNLASCSDDETIRIWDSKNNYQNIHTLEGHSRCVRSLIELSSGNIASCSDDDTIRIWDSKNNYQNIHTLEGHSRCVRSLLELSNGNISSCSDDKSIRLWDSNNKYNSIYTFYGHNEQINSLIKLEQGDIASCSDDQTIRIWNATDISNNVHTLQGHSSKITSLIILCKGNIASCSSDHTIRVWEANDNYKNIRTYKGHTDVVNSILQLNDGNIASCSKDKTIRIWESHSNRNLHTLQGHSDSVNLIIQLYRGENLISCSNDKTIRVWDTLNNYNNIYVLQGHSDSIRSIVELCSGNIASCSNDHLIKIWFTDRQYNNYDTLEGHTNSVTSIITLFDGKIASSSDDKTIKIWDDCNFENLYTLLGHKGSIKSMIKLSKENFASCSDDKTIIIWDCSDEYKQLYVLEGHTFSVNSLLKLPNNKIASCSDDRTIRIWDGKNNYKNTKILEGHSEAITSLVDVDDGKIASISEDLTIRIWIV
jgi:WD40 repeat protein